MYYRAGSSPCTHGQSPSQRDDHFEDVINYTVPDILVVNEMGANPSNPAFIKDFVLNTNGSTKYNAATYTNNNFSGLTNMLFYDSAKVGLLNQHFIDKDVDGNSLVRVIDVYSLYYKDPKLSIGADTAFFTLATAHLKAGSTTSDILERLDATEALMDYLENNVSDNNVIFCGDFNVRSNTEPAFQELINYSDTTENFYDPVNQLGLWNNNSNYTSVHTQSTHSSSSGCFSGGGLDDRFDFFLISREIRDGNFKVKYTPNSYQTIGQDGNHFNQSVNNGTNGSVPSSIADALYNFSDHLPVLMQIDITQSNIGLDEALSLNNNLSYNNPIKNELNLEFQIPTGERTEAKLISLTGKVVLSSNIPTGQKHWTLNTSHLPNGIYLLSTQSANGSKLIKKIIKR
jgi:exonuclease III